MWNLLLYTLPNIVGVLKYWSCDEFGEMEWFGVEASWNMWKMEEGMGDYGWFLCFIDCASLYNLVTKANLVHNFSQCVYFFSLHVSGEYVPIIRRNNCIYVTLGTWHSVWMTVWYAGCTLHTRQSWWWAHSHPKRVEKRNKHTKKNCAPSGLYLQDYGWSFGDTFLQWAVGGTDWDSCLLVGFDIRVLNLPVSYTMR